MRRLWQHLALVALVLLAALLWLTQTSPFQAAHPRPVSRLSPSPDPAATGQRRTATPPPTASATATASTSTPSVTPSPAPTSSATPTPRPSATASPSPTPSQTPAATAAAAPSRAPTPTSTPPHTPTPAPPVQTPAPAPPPPRTAVVVPARVVAAPQQVATAVRGLPAETLDTAYLRPSPSTDAIIDSTLPAGTWVRVTGCAQACNWIEFIGPDGALHWSLAFWFAIQGDPQQLP